MKFTYRFLTCLLAVVLLFAASMPVSAATEEEEQQIRRKISSHYYTTLASTGNESLKGLCGTMTSWQLYLLGVNRDLITNNGNDQYDWYCYKEYTSGGHKIRTYPARDYSMTEALYAATDYGKRDAYNLLVGFQWTNTEAGALYGHAVVIYAILDGKVYFTEGFSTSFGGYEGSAMVLSIPDFVRYYADWTRFEGLIEFGKKDRAYACVKHPADFYGVSLKDVPLYSQPCADPEGDTQVQLLRTIAAMERVHITGIYENEDGELYYCISDHGEEGFVPTVSIVAQTMGQPNITVSNLYVPERIAKGQDTPIEVTSAVAQCETVLALRDNEGNVLDTRTLKGKTEYIYMFQGGKTISGLEEGTYSVAVIAKREQTVALGTEPITIPQEQVIAERYFCIGDAAEIPAVAFATEPPADGWNYLGGQWYYYKNGAPYVGWLCEQGGDYYLQEDGSVTTGWAEILGKPRYFSETGVMRTGWLTIGHDTYYLMCNGVPATGWREIEGKYYYFDANGCLMRNTWLEMEEGTYFVQLDGTMLADGWFDTNRGRKYFAPNGCLQPDAVEY